MLSQSRSVRGVSTIKTPLSKAGDPVQQDRSGDRTTLPHLRHAPAMRCLKPLSARACSPHNREQHICVHCSCPAE